MKRFYVILTWEDWPHGGSYGNEIEAHDHLQAENIARLEMAQIRSEDYCIHCGADTDDGEGFDGFCGNCADACSDDEGEFDPSKALEPTDAAALRYLKENGADWHLVECWDIDKFIEDHLT